MKRIECIEGEPFLLERKLASRLRLECIRLQRQLRPRFAILTEAGNTFVVRGIIGTLQLGAHTLVDIAPKTRATEDWISAILELLVGTNRVDISGKRAAKLSSHKRSLLEALAAIYASRLEHAFRRDGPILVMRRQSAELSTLKGKLDVTEWARQAIWRPHVFPVEFNRLSVDNEFSRALVYVARLLSNMSRLQNTKERLVALARALRPGCPDSYIAPNQPTTRQLPHQWNAYQPAWSLAVAFLSQKSLLGTRGRHHGLSIVVEAWPLLEQLLERSIRAAVQIAKEHNRILGSPPKSHFRILSPSSGSDTEPRSVVPDGILVEAGRTIATFEAKYKKRDLSTNWPAREDIYQALVAAAAARSPLAVLVYPETFEPIRWQVSGLHGYPVELVAAGLGLFGYRRGPGDSMRGQTVLDIINATTAPTLIANAG